MKKVIVTLSSGPAVSLEFPEVFSRKRGEKAEARKIERSVFGAVRLFPGIPKAISASELEYVRAHRKDLIPRLLARPYVESRRVDRRGVSEGELERLAEKEGVGHLPTRRKIEVLTERGKIPKPEPKKAEGKPATEPPKRTKPK
jgi:hypothetical protein